MKLFGYLPEGVFRPLAGPKRHLYARLLQRLYERLFAARILETPSRDDVLRQIEIVLKEEGVASAADLLEGDSDADGRESQAQYIAYHRLRDTGWLIEVREKWHVNVEMHPDGFMLIGSIVELSSSRVRLAGAVVDVKSNLENAAREPVSMAQGLSNAHAKSVQFARNMRRILVGMREIEEQILGNPDPSAILRTFFQDFVDGLLVADYKQLKTSNNPYRHRRQIGTLSTELLDDVERRHLIAQAYMDQGVVEVGTSILQAEERVKSELDKIRQVFEDVDAFMERIESFRDRLERRIRTTVHYMDMVGEGSAERIARLIEGVVSTDKVEVEICLRAPDAGFPITTKALYVPPPPRSPPAKTRFKLPKHDPYLHAYLAATSAFDRIVRVRPHQLISFIEANIGESDCVSSGDMNIERIEDLFSFRSLPDLVASKKAGRIGDYRVVLEEGRTENEWISLHSFRVERIAKAASC